MAWFTFSALSCEGDLEAFLSLLVTPLILLSILALAAVSVLPLFLVPVGAAWFLVGACRLDLIQAVQGLTMASMGAISVWFIYQ